ncbi:hypothetical protein [Bradyrhizobium sp. CCBAU 11430]|uniref:hypothetical protein n=1 Tax=Bradyrhizobium sp. CCBAU 11430 TaxID=1630881 RepID=UPI002305D453|nr:hypothetical protein [Bradyrhizobium sp. CCBAU 11430]
MGTALRAFAHPTALQLGCALEHRDAASYSALRGSCDEAIQSLSEEGFWIASAFAEASADKSRRLQRRREENASNKKPQLRF